MHGLGNQKDIRWKWEIELLFLLTPAKPTLSSNIKNYRNVNRECLLAIVSSVRIQRNSLKLVGIRQAFDQNYKHRHLLNRNERNPPKSCNVKRSKLLAPLLRHLDAVLQIFQGVMTYKHK